MKDALADDPFNMDLIYELGCAYADDGHWKQSVNVLLRGWKRLNEVSDPVRCFSFLIVLCAGSYRLKMYRQALGIINEIKEQEDPSLQRIYLTVACQIHCANEDLPHAVKVFRRAVANTDMDTALSIWAGLQSELRNIGADATAKGAVELLVHSEEDRSKLAAFEQLDEITQTLRSGGKKEQQWPDWRMVWAAIVVLAVILIGFLYRLEAQSFKRFNERK